MATTTSQNVSIRPVKVFIKNSNIELFKKVINQASQVRMVSIDSTYKRGQVFWAVDSQYYQVINNGTRRFIRIQNNEPEYHWVYASDIALASQFSSADGNEKMGRPSIVAGDMAMPPSFPDIKKYVLVKDYDVMYFPLMPKGQPQGMIGQPPPTVKKLLKGSIIEGYIEAKTKKLVIGKVASVPTVTTTIDGVKVNIPMVTTDGGGNKQVILQEATEDDIKKAMSTDKKITVEPPKATNIVVPILIGSFAFSTIAFFVAPKVFKKITLQNKILLSVGAGVVGGVITKFAYPKFMKKDEPKSNLVGGDERTRRLAKKMRDYARTH